MPASRRGGRAVRQERASSHTGGGCMHAACVTSRDISRCDKRGWTREKRGGGNQLLDFKTSIWCKFSRVAKHMKNCDIDACKCNATAEKPFKNVDDPSIKLFPKLFLQAFSCCLAKPHTSQSQLFSQAVRHSRRSSSSQLQR